MWQFAHLLHTCDVYAVALGKQLNFLVCGHHTIYYHYIMTHDMLSSGVT